MEKLMLTISDLQELLSISRTQLYKIRKKYDDFPRPVDLGERTLRWKIGDIQEWINKQQ
mgnify:CR=1 FL=1|tara:strand:+ start:259 stop:435 length:177 start_codon:yes stop_codon:yes gene_type:complete